MNEYLWMATIGIVSIGLYMTHLINKISDLNEQLEQYHIVVLEMAKELKSLGSDKVNIYYEDDEE